MTPQDSMGLGNSLAIEESRSSYLGLDVADTSWGVLRASILGSSSGIQNADDCSGLLSWIPLSLRSDGSNMFRLALFLLRTRTTVIVMMIERKATGPTMIPAIAP